MVIRWMMNLVNKFLRGEFDSSCLSYPTVKKLKNSNYLPTELKTIGTAMLRRSIEVTMPLPTVNPY